MLFANKIDPEIDVTGSVGQSLEALAVRALYGRRDEMTTGLGRAAQCDTPAHRIGAAHWQALALARLQVTLERPWPMAAVDHWPSPLSMLRVLWSQSLWLPDNHSAIRGTSFFIFIMLLTQADLYLLAFFRSDVRKNE
jgi:hypothetical protein